MARSDAKTMVDVAVITTAHWAGDPRLNRHIQYLDEIGLRGELMSFAAHNRVGSVLRALGAIVTTNARVVILPDPELFFAGSIVARATLKRPVIDIHENYPKTATARSWIPHPLRPLVGALAQLAVALGRYSAWRVVVAAPELASRGDTVVLNIPDPNSLRLVADRKSNQLVYIGDISPARGVFEMVEVLAALDDSFQLLLIGRIDQSTRKQVLRIAEDMSIRDRIRLTGQLNHDEAWHLAEGSLVGLNLLRPVPAYRDAVATKLWEYMAVGLPPVVSNLPGQSDRIGAIDEGLVCDSPAAVANIVLELSRNETRRKRIVTLGRQLVEEVWAEKRPDLGLQSVVTP